MANIFQKDRVSSVRSNYFNLSHTHLTSTKFGRLQPIMVQECLPNDQYRYNPEIQTRFMPLVAPVMGRTNIYTHTFFVPNRILWPNFESMITGGRSGTESPAIPRVSDDHVFVSPNSLLDYMGFPVLKDVRSEDFNLLAMAAYQKIYEDYYMDQNLSDYEFRPLTDGATNSWSDYSTVRQRAWRKDMFTSALPTPQRGPSVHLPLGESAPVYRDYDNSVEPTASLDTNGGTGPQTPVHNVPSNQSYEERSLYADLREATAITVAELRNTVSIQQFFEKLNRGGSRYFEVIKSFFGGRNLDARLDRPEYVGGSISPITVSEVLQTSEGTSGSPQANMAGHGISYNRGKQQWYRAPEHGWLITIASVLPEAIYTQGLDRMFSRMDRFDFYWDNFAHIGEQAILNKELFYDDEDEQSLNETFGYTPRYAEYRYKPSVVTAEMRRSLSFWTFARKFYETPNLNDSFVKVDGDADYLKNPFAVIDPEEDYILINVRNHLHARRPVAKWGTPRV